MYKLFMLSSFINWSNWGSTRRCATGCWTFWPGDLRQYGSAVTHPAPSHWTQGPPKDVCWAPSSSLCWPTTAHRHTTPTSSLNLRMTRLWWVSSATEMRQTTGARWAAWPGGQWQQPLSECGEDEEDCRWLQESALSACSSVHQWCDRGESEQHQVPGCTHHRGPLLDQQHCSTGQESTTASLLPPQTKKSQSPGPHHVHLLQRHHREHPD